MTERKFTPPTSFPAKYRDGTGEIIALLAKGNGDDCYIGQNKYNGWVPYTENGVCVGGLSEHDLHDIPKTQVRWTNDYKWGSGVEWYESRDDVGRHDMGQRIAIIRREWTEGEAPKYFTEEV